MPGFLRLVPERFIRLLSEAGTLSEFSGVILKDKIFNLIKFKFLTRLFILFCLTRRLTLHSAVQRPLRLVQQFDLVN